MSPAAFSQMTSQEEFEEYNFQMSEKLDIDLKSDST